MVLTALVIAHRYLLNKELKKEIGPDARIEQVYSFEAMRELGIEMKELKKTVEKLQRKSNPDKSGNGHDRLEGNQDDEMNEASQNIIQTLMSSELKVTHHEKTR